MTAVRRPASRKPAKALTVRQPWAGLIVAGVKDVENRSWPTNYRGRIFIHAAQAVDRNGPSVPPDLEKLCSITGAIVGTVETVDCIRGARSKWALRGHWHWLLDGAKRCRPRIMQGRLGLWIVE